AGAGGGQLRLGEPLQPAVVSDPLGVLGGEAGHRRRVGPAVLLRPVDPGAGEAFGEGAVGGEAGEGVALLGAEGVEGRGAARGAEPDPEMLEGGALQLPDPLPVDAPVGVEGPPLGGEGGEVDPAGTGLGVAGLAGAGHLFDPEVE